MGPEKIAQNSFFPLDREKNIAVAHYVLGRLEDCESNNMYLLKLIFFADRYHIRKYLRPVTADSYFAMERGAVASEILNLCKGNIPNESMKPITQNSVQLIGDP